MDVDDQTIQNDWLLLRRIPLIIGGTHPQIVRNDNTGEFEPSSMAFTGHPTNPRAFSVHLEPVLIENGLTAKDVLLDANQYALVGFKAGEARGAQQVLERRPLPNEPAHAHVVGEKKSSIRKALKKCAVWIIPPPANLEPI